MKILWVSHLVPYPPKAGVLLRSHYLVKELAKHHDLDLLALSQKDLIEPYFDNFEQGLKKSKEVMDEICNRVEFFPCPVDSMKYGKHLCALRSLVSRNPYTINWVMDDQFRNAIETWHQQHNYDVIHFDTISLVPYIDNLPDVTLALDHHNVESHMLIRRAGLESNPLKKLYFWQEGKRLEKVEQEYCPKFHTNITCSDLDTERFKEIIPNARFETIPNGVDTDFFQPGTEPPKPNKLIFIGTLDWYPNTRAVQFLAHDIWPIVREQHPDLEVDIIGSRPPSDLVELSNNDDRFNVHGFVDDLMPYLLNATIYVCPINDGGGTKLKLLDAFSAGKAVIADPIACEGLYVTDKENVYLASSAEEYAKGIAELLADSELRQRLEKNARNHAVDSFSFASIGKALADHYQEVHEGRKAIT